MEHYNMNLTLKVWRQKNSKSKGSFETFKVNDISSEMSFLEMFDVLNERLIEEQKEPVAFDHDCREGICGACSMYIDGQPHGPWQQNTTCQLHMRAFKDGDTIVVEPWRSTVFPVIKDLMVDRRAFDRIVEAGGFISTNTGNAVDANAIPVSRAKSEEAFDAAVIEERNYELCFEYDRWFDLVRKRILKEKSLPQIQQNFTEADYLFPIPDNDILLNPELGQNPGY